MKKWLIWLWMLAKRQLRKPAFLVILALLPLATLLYSTAAGQDSGMITVALAQEDPSDPLADRMIRELSSELIRFVISDPGQAREAVETGKADAAWIFPAELETRLNAFLNDPSRAAMTVVQREETTALRLSREVLSGAVYRCIGPQVYLSYVRQNAPSLDGISEEELLSWYNGITGNENLFHFQTPEGDAAPAPAGYLKSSLRGLLGILMALTGLACALYFRQDRRKGTFANIPSTYLPLLELGCQIPALAATGFTAAMCLTLCGLSPSFGREIAVGVLYCLCTAAFSMMLSRLWGSEGLLAALLGVLAVAMLAVCPVFFDIAALRPLQFLFPPTYYIRAATDNDALLSMAAYTLVCFLGCIPLSKR